MADDRWSSSDALLLVCFDSTWCNTCTRKYMHDAYMHAYTRTRYVYGHTRVRSHMYVTHDVFSDAWRVSITEDMYVHAYVHVHMYTNIWQHVLRFAYLNNILVHRVVLYTPVDEHFGIVPVEAMYSRRPILACNSGGPQESVGEARLKLPHTTADIDKHGLDTSVYCQLFWCRKLALAQHVCMNFRVVHMCASWLQVIETIKRLLDFTIWCSIAYDPQRGTSCVPALWTIPDFHDYMVYKD